jgi:hypothetical protein
VRAESGGDDWGWDGVMAKIQYQRSDKRPAYGDTKTENGKRYKRVFQRIRDWSGRCIGINYTGGRYHYVWEEIADARRA